MPSTGVSRTFRNSWAIGAISIALGGALVAVGWLDYASTRREFAALVRAQATSARDMIAAAARANRAAASEARGQLAERLLDNARLLAEIDRRGGLSAAALSEIAARNHIFRITILAPDGTRERFVSSDWQGRGFGPASGSAGAGAGGALLLDRLLHNGEQEAVTDLHEGRRGGVARLAAGVRRSNGGAILLSVDATEVANLLRQSSLDALLADIVRSAGDVAFIVFEDAEVTKTAGEVPGAAGSSDARILEITGPIDVGGPHPALLRVGMRLDRLRLAERRTLGRLALTVVTAAALGVLALGLVGAGRRFGALSAEHALAQEALRRKDRLAAMGELSSTVAHEIRNPLNAIAMSAQRLERECLGRGGGADGDDARELVSVIKREAQRMNGKVQQFLEYARPPSLNRQPIEIGPWLSGVIAAVHPVADERHVRLLLDTRSSAVALIDGDQMRQALDNLLLNAIDATPQGGTVSVRAVVADGLAIEVHDTGAGIPAEVLPKIFDLYFTTKPGGTGVGLAVTQQIVAAHGGTVEVDGAGGRGTTMRIRVPLQEEAARG